MKKKTIGALLLAVVILVSQLPVRAFAGSTRLPELEHEDFDFNSLEYEHLENEFVDYIQKYLDEIAELCNDEKNTDYLGYTLVWMENDIFPYLEELEFVAWFNYMLNPRDKYWSEEYQYIQQINIDLHSLFDTNFRILCHSACKDAVYYIRFEGFLEEYLAKEEESASEETVTEAGTLFEEIDSLIFEYRTFIPSVEIDGITYTEQDLISAFDSGIISYEEFEKIDNELKNVRIAGYTDFYFNLIKKYNALAKQYGYDNYLDYVYKELFGRWITPEEAEKEAEDILKVFGPYKDCFLAYNNAKLLKDTEKILDEDIISVGERIIGKIAPELKESYKYMMDTNTCFVAPKSSTVNPYTHYYGEIPYICMKKGDYKINDLESLIHEFGHYNVFYWTNNIYSLDIDELYSQGMEMLATQYYEEVFGDLAEKAEKKVLGRLMADIYQDAVFTKIESMAFHGQFETSRDLLEAINLLLENYYGPDKTSWYNYYQFYEVPAYFYSYMSSGLSALELYAWSKENPEAAVDSYIKLISCYSSDTGWTKKEAGFTVNWTRKKLERLFNKLYKGFAEADAPVVNGVENGKVYTEPVEIRIEDESGIYFRVIKEGEEYYYSARDHVIEGSNSPIHLTVIDAFGNSVDMEFVVEPKPFVLTGEVTGDEGHKLSWSRQGTDDSMKYLVYGAPLGEKYRKIVTLPGTELSFVNKDTGGKTWKYYVVPVDYTAVGKPVRMQRSMKCFLVSGENEKYTNTKAIEIEGKEESTLKKGQKVKLSVTLTKELEDKRLYSTKKIPKIRYYSSDTNVAVISDGTITAVSEGTCYIYAISENGFTDRIKLQCK